MANAVGIEVSLLGQGELEHYLLTRWQSVQLLEEGLLEQGFSFGLLRTMNVNLRLDDGHQARVDDPAGNFKLLLHDVLDAGRVRLLDHRAHLGTEDMFR